MWPNERARKDRATVNGEFSLCCMKGKVQLPLLQSPPHLLIDLLSRNSQNSKHFVDSIRAYNLMFAFTSMGGKVDKTVNQGKGPYSFRLGGQASHLMGSLVPLEGKSAKFQQLYIVDTENEILNRKRAVSFGRSDGLLDDIVTGLKEMLDEHNSYAKVYRMARDRIRECEQSTVHLKLLGNRAKDGRTYNLPSASEVAALVVGDIGSFGDERDIVVQYQSGKLERISELKPCYLPLQYPLLFPYGEDGFRLGIPRRGFLSIEMPIGTKRVKLTMREWFAFRLMDRENAGGILLRAGKLLQQFMVDGWIMVETERLSFIRHNQSKLRSESYDCLRQAVAQGRESTTTGRRVVLPSTFQGGQRFMNELYHDAMGICKTYGYPDVFITFTCNPKWPEVTRALSKKGLRSKDRHDILTRIFKIKLDEMIKDLTKGMLFGKTNAVVYSVEFQKRGLPHAHIVLFLHRDYKIPNPEDIDTIICAEIPDREQNPTFHEIVRDLMMHGPCGLSNMKSPCMKDRKCMKHFPKKFNECTSVDGEGYPVYRRRDDGAHVVKNNIVLDNRFVVPYNPKLLLKYRAHINVEWCNQSRAIKYLFKYINKGNDRVTAGIYRRNGDNDGDVEVDEIKEYYDCRYVSPCEAMCRILGFEIHYRTPPVERLSYHLPNEQTVIFDEEDAIDSVVNKPSINSSKFLAWMECNSKYPEARELRYYEFPGKYVWNRQGREWTPRKQGFSIGRMYHASPVAGERYYLRTLLNYVRGPTYFEDIRTVSGVLYNSFKEACYAMGLLDDDKEYVDAIIEASFWGTGSYLRNLFAILLMSNSVSRPEFLWDKTWHVLSEDILHKQRRILSIPEVQLKNFTLHEIENILKRNGCSLRDYSGELCPDDVIVRDSFNKLIADELRYDKEALRIEHQSLMRSLTDEQRQIYAEIMSAISSRNGGVYFLYGHGGAGKTFMWRTLCAALRCEGEIVLPVASSGIASLLLPMGRTAHSRFGIPINVTEDSMCRGLEPGTNLSALLERTSLIIWDEAPMMSKYCFEALDRSMRDALRGPNGDPSDKPFAGKVIVFGGDFRQILPVVPKGSRQDIVFASLNSSYIWDFCKVLRLTKNMRLQTENNDVDEIRQFADWILQIGDGLVGGPNDGEATIDIPSDILITEGSDPIRAIVESTYPNIQENLLDSTLFHDRVILAPTNEVVLRVNDYVLSLMSGEEKIYLSSDSISKSNDNAARNIELYSVEFLNTIKCSGLPNHEIRLKIGSPIMLLRNIDQAAGLCNGTRLVVNQLGLHIIEATVLSGSNKGAKVFIPRITLTPSDSSHLPVCLQRRQFPVTLCFAMTINKSQGQSLKNVGLFFIKTSIQSWAIIRSCITRDN